MTGEEQLAAGFEAQRPYLRTLAFRVLGSDADAEDAVQEAWLRLARAGGAGIDDLRGWLTTVTGRICLDVLRSRRTRSEQPLELSLGLLTAETTADPGVSPEDHVLLAGSVGLALSVVMDALTPAERVSFVLHDVFEVPFDAIARILDRSTAATKMLASRARGRIRLGTPAESAQQPAGWLSPWLSESHVTSDLVAEAGYQYTLNWCHDDQPTQLHTRNGQRLWAIPYTEEVNDIPMILARQMDAKSFADLVIDHFEEMLRQSAREPEVARNRPDSWAFATLNGSLAYRPCTRQCAASGPSPAPQKTPRSASRTRPTYQ